MNSYLCLKVKNAKGTTALEKIVLHQNVAKGSIYTWYGLDSNIGDEKLDTLIKGNATVLFYISPKDNKNPCNRIAYIGILKGYKTFPNKRKDICPFQEIPSIFRKNPHRLFLKISKIKTNIKLDYKKFRSTNKVKLKDLRSGLTIVNSI